jgi:hypothetical protein
MRARSCLSLAIFLVACGDRTGLLVPDERGGSSGSVSSGSASSGTGDDGGPQVEPDAEVVEDALPPIDVTVPQDAFNDCPNANATFIYVVTKSFELLSFYPPTAQFRTVGTLKCPSASNPFSMAVDRTGVAYVLYEDGELFRVSTATAACKATAFVSDQGGFSQTFGMGYSHDNQGTGETLYVAGSSGTPQLAIIDPTTFALKIVGPFVPAIQRAELTGTGTGDLFAFFEPTTGSDSFIGQIDKPSGKLTNQSTLKGIQQGSGWAFAFWGGDFYMFTAPAGQTVVTRYRPTDQTLVTVATRSDVVVGAGVSTCAPAQ